MNLQAKIDQDLNQAIRDKDDLVRSTLRLLKSSIKNAEISLGKTLTDQEIIGIVSREIKQRHESIDQYTKANRLDLAAKENEEAGVLEKYLPPQLSDDEIKSIVTQAIASTGASSPQDMGKVMAAVMPQVQGKADGSKVSALVQEALRHA